MKPKQQAIPKFATYLIADISTKHITEADGRLVGLASAPGHIGSIDECPLGGGSPGDIYAVFKDPELHRHLVRQLKEFGFSTAFINIIRAVYKQKIAYVRFDRDGDEVYGLPVFHW
jgi:hypothetical protein